MCTENLCSLSSYALLRTLQWRENTESILYRVDIEVSLSGREIPVIAETERLTKAQSSGKYR
jgi:hypothetical protein